MEYDEAKGLSAAQMATMQGGSPDLLAKALICRDPDVAAPRAGGGRYDLTLRFIQEISEFPFGGHEDLIDAASRIYDMDPTPPMVPSTRHEVVQVYRDGV